MRSWRTRNQDGLIGAALMLLQIPAIWITTRAHAEDASSVAARKTAAPAAQTAGSDAAADIYVDQVIEPGLDGRLFDAELMEEEEEPEGRRYLSVEYQYYRDKRDPYDDWENGILLNWRLAS